jgi:hypothetical protein
MAIERERPRTQAQVSGSGDADLYLRGTATLLASWEQYARGSSGAALHRLAGVAAAVFPSDPERAVYNNAVLDRDLTAAARAAMAERVYAAAGFRDLGRILEYVPPRPETRRP